MRSRGASRAGAETSTEASYDVVVVGSGAGGAVIASELSERGLRVLVIERGPWVEPDDISHDELAMIATLYRDGGAQTNTDADMFVLQGSCVGGSTVLTNAVCFRMPEEVRLRFESYGWRLSSEDMARCSQYVETAMSVAPLDERLHNAAAQRMHAGMQKLGLEIGRFDKAFDRCIGCGYCNVGCAFGRKRDASTVWIPRALAAGCRVLPRTEALRLQHRAGHVEALLCRDLETGRHFKVSAKRYVLAAGALHTPELLLRSGLGGRNVGKRTSFNAGAIAFAEYEEELDAFDGDQMCVHYFGEGYVIEQIHNPPMSFALTMPGWFDEHHAAMQRYRKRTAAGVLVPTQAVGRVFRGLGSKLLTRWFDHPNLAFRLPEEDVAAFRRGFKMLARVFLASGAKLVIPPLATFTELRSEDELYFIDERLQEQRDLVGFGSSHPQGGACMGDDPSRDVVAPNYRVYDADCVHVVDASLFPESVRVNPMISIMAVAKHAAESIAALVEASPSSEAVTTC